MKATETRTRNCPAVEPMGAVRLLIRRALAWLAIVRGTLVSPFSDAPPPPKIIYRFDPAPHYADFYRREALSRA